MLDQAQGQNVLTSPIAERSRAEAQDDKSMGAIYDYTVDLNADTSHTRTIRLTGRDKRVLEFGCATGYIAKILTEQFGCTVTGIELSPEAAAKARLVCHRVICGDAETLAYTRELDGDRFDVVLFADVLEHLKDPAAVLRKIKNFIEPDGYVVASIPNITHAAVALELLAGRFDYRALGLLDITHLRFFSRRTIQALFESSGYIIAEVSRIEAEPAATEFQTRLADFPPAVVEFALGQEEATTYQFIIKAYPSTETGALAELRTKLEAAREAEAERGAEAAHLREQFEAARQTGAEWETQVAQLRQQLEAARESLSQREAAVAALGQDLEATKSALAERQVETAWAREALETTRGALAGREADVSRLREQLDGTDGLLSQRERELGELGHELETTRAVQQAEVMKLGQELEATQRTLDDLHARAQCLEGELAATRSYIQAILNTKSWKLTAPLRLLKRKVAAALEIDLPRVFGWTLTLKLRRRLRLRRAVKIIKHSGLFDAPWYLSQYPQIAREGIDPIYHYVQSGASAGYDPNPLFDTSWYVEQYPEVGQSGLTPLVHYALSGAAQGYAPHPQFDTSSYLKQQPETAGSDINPLAHLLRSRPPEGDGPNRPPPHSPDPQTAPGDRVEPPRQPPPTLRVSELTGPLDRAVCLPANDGGPWLICVSHVRPHPPRAGNEYRLQRMLRWIASKGFRVVLVHASLPGDEPTQKAVADLATVYPYLVICQRDGIIRHRLGEVGALIARLDGRQARDFPEDCPQRADQRTLDLQAIERTFAHSPLIEALLALQEGLAPKVLLVTYVFMTRFLPLLGPKALKIIDTIDVFSLRHDKVQRYGIPDSLALSPDEEARCLARADIIVAIQPEEEKELIRLAADKSVVTAGVDFDLVPLSPARDGKVVLLIASDNPFNVKGAQDFLRLAWPLVKRHVPDAEFWMAGKISEAVESRGVGVKLLGQSEDLDRLYATAAVTINPAVAGTGVKIKTLESLSRLRPVVCWPSGVDGLPPELHQRCHVAENWYDFAAKVMRCLQDSDSGSNALWARREMIGRLLAAETVYSDLWSVLSETIRTR